MKRIVIGLAALVTFVGGCFAQGTIQFLNSSLSRVIYYQIPGAPPVYAPPGTHIGVFWGTDAAGPAAVAGIGQGTLVTPTAVIGSAPGIWSGSAVYPIAGTQEGQRVWLKIAGWIGGTDTSIQGATAYGESAVVSVVLGPTTGPGTVVWQSASGTATDRAKPFVLIPEPSVWSISALGLVAFVLCRRKSKSQQIKEAL
jgi:hypothetical protein